MKIVRFLKNKNMGSRIENTPRKTLMNAFCKGTKYEKHFNQKPKKSRKRKAALEPEPEPAVEDDFEQEIEVRKKYPNEDTPIPQELELIPDSGSPNDNVMHLYNEYYKIPNYQNKYKTQNLLVIGRSKIPGAGLGLFAFVPLETRNLPENKKNWTKINKKKQK